MIWQCIQLFRIGLKDKNAGRIDEPMKQKDVKGKEEIVNKSVHLFKYIIDHTNVCFSLLISLRTCLWAFGGTYFENVPFSVGSIFVPVCPKKLWIHHCLLKPAVYTLHNNQFTSKFPVFQWNLINSICFSNLNENYFI